MLRYETVRWWRIRKTRYMISRRLRSYNREPKIITEMNENMRLTVYALESRWKESRLSVVSEFRAVELSTFVISPVIHLQVIVTNKLKALVLNHVLERTSLVLSWSLWPPICSFRTLANLLSIPTSVMMRCAHTWCVIHNTSSLIGVLIMVDKLSRCRIHTVHHVMAHLLRRWDCSWIPGIHWRCIRSKTLKMILETINKPCLEVLTMNYRTPFSVS